MASLEKILEQVLRGTADANVEFNDLRTLLSRLGFEARIKGGHHVFVLRDKPVLINLQREGRKAKPYQVRQVRRIITEHGLTGNL